MNPASALLAGVENILQEAARLVREAFLTAGPVAFEGTVDSPVTAVDRSTDQLLKARLQVLFPEAGWLSEETADDPLRLEREWVWIVDPIDGTREFVKKVPEFTISIGLARNGAAFLGGIMNPVTGEGGVGLARDPSSGSGESRFWGFRSEARRSGAVGLQDALTAVSRREWESGMLERYRALISQPRPMGSVAYKLLRVAAGVEDLTLASDPKSEWDICGGVALLSAVGREYRRLDGLPVSFNQREPRIASGSIAGVSSLLDGFQAAFRR